MRLITLKRGDTLNLVCTVQQQGQPLDITGWQIDCWVRAPGGKLVHRLAVVIGNLAAAGTYLLSATSAETSGWPTGHLSADIRYADAAGCVMHTCDVSVQVLDAVTTL